MTLPSAKFFGRTLVLSVLMLVGGCCCGNKPHGQPGPVGLSGSVQSEPANLEKLHLLPEAHAWVDPPIGWRRDKFDVDARHTHVTWLSPSGNTAYGVVFINLPLPVGPETVLWGFLNHLRAADKQADLVEKQPAPDLSGIRFIADSGLYRIRVNLSVYEWHAWAVYAGTLREKPVMPDELALAEQARDRTRVGMGTTMP